MFCHKEKYHKEYILKREMYTLFELEHSKIQIEGCPPN